MSLSPKIDSSIWNAHALLTCEEMRRAEALSVARGSHSFFDLMQVAGRAVAQAVMDRFAQGRVLVMCGCGNNGGDGYVAAQALWQAGWPVRIGTLGAPTTVDAQKAASFWEGETLLLSPALLDEADLVIDAMFGTGLTRPLEGLAAQMVDAVTTRNLPVVAADMPSGINADTGAVLGCAVQAQVTVTFFRKKRGHTLLPALAHCGDVIVADTGMHADVLDEINSIVAENDSALWGSLQPKCEVANHKYHRGHVLIFGGAEMTGASRLAARAAQRIGAGLVTLAAPSAAWEVYAKALESVMVRHCDDLSAAQEFLDNSKIDVVLLGPGLGFDDEKRALVLAALKTRKPCVLDADALMLFEKESSILFDSVHKNCVLTPHQGEFKRLFGQFCCESEDKITQTTRIASRIGCIILHKGGDTVISEPNGRAVVNTNAPPWLATAGAGDVLAGLIVGLMAGGMPPFEAACAGAYRHGQAACRFGRGLIAEDLIENIPSVLVSDYS
ncbi:MAG: NAD(P)H-hydrate dehydratase [Alphaproteobacteria bacterium]|nr:NAD(P)H-hydrate dehydratase [Alphaproteobacteria bacterium]